MNTEAEPKRARGRPRKNPEDIKQRVDKRPRVGGAGRRINNGKVKGYSGFVYKMKFKNEPEMKEFNTLQNIADHYGVSYNFIRKLKSLDWETDNLRGKKHNTQEAEIFEDIEFVNYENISVKYMNQLAKEREEDIRRQTEEYAS